MTLQNYEIKDRNIDDAFQKLKQEHPGRLRKPLKLSWSNWGFGREPLEASLERLANNGLEYVELHGNHYAPDFGYEPATVKKALKKVGMQVSGICGMFGAENDLSSNLVRHQQAAIDYIRRELDFALEVRAHYLLVVPGAVGRPDSYDANEIERSADTLRMVGDRFASSSVRAAIEPIRSAEVSFVHTFADAVDYIRRVDHPAIEHINGDLYHMLTEENHIGSAIVDYADRLVNLHAADSNRGALGTGFLDIDTIIKALYVTGYNQDDRFVTFEPLGPGGDPYPALYGSPDPAALDSLVGQSIQYFRERERALTEA